MAVTDWQFEYEGLVLGSGTRYPIGRISGLNPPDARREEVVRMNDHGAFTYAEFLPAREIIIEGDIVDDGSDFEALVTAWRQAFKPQSSDQPLIFDIPGDGDVQKRINCVPTRRFFDIDTLYSIGYGRYAVALLAGDPRIYSNALDSLVISPGTPPGGVDFDVDFDLNFGGGSSVSGNASNDGIFPSPPTAIIDGPCTNPKVQNDNAAGGTKFVQMNITLTSSDQLVIDFLARTITLNGTASRYNTLSDDSEWWSVEPGNNTIQFIVSGATGDTQLTLNWRDAWI